MKVRQVNVLSRVSLVQCLLEHFEAVTLNIVDRCLPCQGKFLIEQRKGADDIDHGERREEGVQTSRRRG